MLEKKWVIFLLLMQCIFCKAQQEIITSHQNKEFPKLDIVLKGKVKNMIQTSYSPNKLCDTISSYTDDSSYENWRYGEIIVIKCSYDTIIYNFDNNLSPKMIKEINITIDEGNRRIHRETIYLFENGNLISEISSQNGKVFNESAYKYDLNNNLISKVEDLSSQVVIDSLEYDNNNNLIKKLTYYISGYTLKKSDFKKIKRQYILKKKKKFILMPTVYDSEEYQYDAFGHLISKKWNNNQRKDIYIYDTLGNKIEEGFCENYKRDVCKYIPSKGFIYDKNNRIIKTFSIGNWKPNNTETYYQYDEHGQEIEVKGYYIYNKKDTVIGYHWIYEYDEHGQQIKEEVIEGRPFYHSSLFNNYKILITTYDNYKNITKQEYYTAANQIGYVICYVYTYDSYGNWIKKEEFRGKNKDELLKTNIDERKLEYY